jgi:hypothetical protein
MHVVSLSVINCYIIATRNSMATINLLKYIVYISIYDIFRYQAGKQRIMNAVAVNITPH